MKAFFWKTAHAFVKTATAARHKDPPDLMQMSISQLAGLSEQFLSSPEFTEFTFSRPIYHRPWRFPLGYALNVPRGYSPYAKSLPWNIGAYSSLYRRYYWKLLANMMGTKKKVQSIKLEMYNKGISYKGTQAKMEDPSMALGSLTNETIHSECSAKSEDRSFGFQSGESMKNSNKLTASQRIIHCSKNKKCRNNQHYYNVPVRLDLSELTKLQSKLIKASKQPILLLDILIKVITAACVHVPPTFSASTAFENLPQLPEINLCVARYKSHGIALSTILDASIKGIEQVSADLSLYNPPHNQDKFTFAVSAAGKVGKQALISDFSNCPACILSFDQKELSDTLLLKKDKEVSATLTCNRRIITGRIAADWINEFKLILKHPHLMLL